MRGRVKEYGHGSFVELWNQQSCIVASRGSIAERQFGVHQLDAHQIGIQRNVSDNDVETLAASQPTILVKSCKGMVGFYRALNLEIQRVQKDPSLDVLAQE